MGWGGSRPPWSIVALKKKNGKVLEPSPTIVVNNTRTFEKIRCKGESYRVRILLNKESYRFIGYRDPLVQTDRHTHTQTQTLLLLFKVGKIF